MFIRILKTNPLVSIVFPVLLAAGIWISMFMVHGYVQLTNGIPMFNVFWGWLLKFPALSIIAGFCLLVAEAFIWNTFINNETLLKQSSNLPALFYILLFSCRPIQVSFYPSLLASLFLILAIKRVAESYKKEKALSEVFDTGLFIGIAALFYFPAAIFILFLWIVLLNIRSIVWRELIISLIGFLLPFMFALVYYAVFLSPEDLLHNKLIAAIGSYKQTFSFSWKQILMLSVFGVTGLISLLFYLQKFSDNVVKNQKIWGLILWFSTFSLAAGILSPLKDTRSFSLLALPGSFIFSNYFLRTKSKWIPEFLFILILGVIVISVFY